MSHNHQKKIAVLGDLSGFGRCSLAVSLPIISHLGVQCCPLPTAIFSNHTGFSSFHFFDCTDHISPIMEEWGKLHLEFEGILTGFLGSARQIDLVEEFLGTFTTSRTTIVIDPVMGEHGKPYATYTPELCRDMKRLVGHAHILTPNVTEACILTDTPFQETFSEKALAEMAKNLSDQGPAQVVITGHPRGDVLENFCYEAGKGVTVCPVNRVAPQRSGTGDLFAAIVAAGAVRQVPFLKSVEVAGEFIRRCLIRSAELDIPTTDGVCFEELMDQLTFQEF